jgi:nitroimidazol reductase NimA-like FMN-containing flavoprotein (pyridoxamine 5'-phosphate oxidase superfamily)
MVDEKETLKQYLRSLHDALLWKLDGLGERDLRRPLTPTGTNLLGLVKHVASIELGYFGEVFGRPSGIPLPWYEDGAEDNADMWVPAEETTESVRGLLHQAWAHTEATSEALELDAPGLVPWWGEDRQHVTLHTIFVHVITDVARHAGQADIVRELIDGRVGLLAGNENLPEHDPAWWAAYVDRLQAAADEAEAQEVEAQEVEAQGAEATRNPAVGRDARSDVVAPGEASGTGREMRRGDRALGDAAARAVLERETWGVLATVDEAAQPYGVPVNYAYDGGESLVIHGASEGHRLGNVRANPRASFTVVGRARTEPEHFTTVYESAIAFGRVAELTGADKRAALVQLAERLGPDDPRARDSYIDAGLERVAVLRFEIERLTGKARAGEQGAHGQ